MVEHDNQPLQPAVLVPAAAAAETGQASREPPTNDRLASLAKEIRSEH